MNDSDPSGGSDKPVFADEYKYKPGYDLTRHLTPREPAAITPDALSHPLFMTGLPKDYATNPLLKTFADIAAGVIQVHQHTLRH